MKNLAKIFFVLALLLTNMMCIVVSCVCVRLYYLGQYAGASAPWSVGLLYAIPFAVSIVACYIITFYAYKKEKK